ncbi:MAG: ABC transporter substrate-binding protein, partial [Gemmatimonadota bacterium]|nr:ABC transporter substrate-binding protein [Gemmatimonadota bacterium]
LYNGLLTLDSNLTPQPELAERWEVAPGGAGARYRFHLRQGVRWHDGQPFTAADVKYTFEEVLLRFHARTRASLAPALERVDVVDDSTVEFVFRRPYAPLLQQLDVVEAPILPKHIYAGTDPLRNPANTAPIGTGPFRFESYRPNGEIRYSANRAYFRGAPAIDDVVLREIPDAGTQVMALEAGEVDWLFAVPGPEGDRLRRDPRFRLIRTAVNPGGSNCITTFGFNLDRPWFRDVRVRHGIAHAIDRRQFLERVLFGEGRVADAPISSRIAFAHAADLQIPAFDTGRAAQLLEEAGWHRAGRAVRTARGVAGIADGTPFEIGFKGLPGQMVFGELLRAQLRGVGIDLRLEPLEQAVFSQVVFTARDFDTSIASYCNGTDPEIGVRRQYVTSSIAPVPFSNMAGYRNPVMDSLFDRASAALDMNERRRLYREIQEIAVRDQPYVWLVETLATRAHTVRCHGFGTSSHFAATARCDAR